jgi:hypothetical protein
MPRPGETARGSTHGVSAAGVWSERAPQLSGAHASAAVGDVLPTWMPRSSLQFGREPRWRASCNTRPASPPAHRIARLSAPAHHDRRQQDTPPPSAVDAGRPRHPLVRLQPDPLRPPGQPSRLQVSMLDGQGRGRPEALEGSIGDDHKPVATTPSADARSETEAP